MKRWCATEERRKKFFSQNTKDNESWKGATMARALEQRLYDDWVQEKRKNGIGLLGTMIRLKAKSIVKYHPDWIYWMHIMVA